MKAAVCRAFGEPLTIEDLVLDPPRAGEVRVTVKAVAVCGSDIHAANGSWGGELPVVLGHEAAGVVAELGEGVTELAVGDHVVVSLLRNCQTCFYCTRRQSQLCENEWALSSQHRIHDQSGDAVRQGIYVGAFAEEVVVHRTQCVAVPSDIPFDCASLLACGVITGFGAVVNTASVEPGATVAVIGTGGVGLNTVQGAVAAGAKTIMALDTASEKLVAAKKLGATHAFDATDPACAELVGAATDGRGPDYVFVTAGSPRAIEQGLELVRPGGTVVVVGIGANDTYASIELGEFASGERKILGSKMGSSDLRRDIPALVTRYLEGRLLLDDLVTGRFSLDEINQAMDGVGVGSTLRNVVVFP